MTRVWGKLRENRKVLQAVRQAAGKLIARVSQFSEVIWLYR